MKDTYNKSIIGSQSKNYGDLNKLENEARLVENKIMREEQLLKHKKMKNE